MRLLTVLVLATIAWIPAALASDGLIHGCVSSRKGSLRVVGDPSECSSKETPISWNVQGPPGPSLRVFDATGVEIGIYVDGGGPTSADGPLRVFHEPSATTFRLTSESLSLPDVTLFFEDAACGGTPFVNATQAHGGVLLNSFGLGFVAVENATLPTIMTIRSFLNESGCFSQNADQSVVPVRLIPDLGLTFPLPSPLYVALPPE